MELRPKPHATAEPAVASQHALAALDVEPGVCRFFAWQNTIIAIWYGTPTGAAVERLARLGRRMAPGFPDGFSTIYVVKSGVGMPTAEARAGFVALMREYGEPLACVASVLLGAGFWMSAIQGAITGMHMLLPRSFEHRLLGSLEATVAWLPAHHFERTGVALDPKALHAALSQAYDRSLADANGTP